ncbi:bactofilin family protein [Paenibacillus gansuensis]|uniref:Polymer-forming cytoskeletal protein n=1 Tax=Paenibacillus gansuensis TaxID=306542 RepID=A0ABW5PGJ7_9BACL
MFSKKKAKLNPNATDTLVGEGTIFDGKIVSEAGVRIEGQVTGGIDCQGDVAVGENGVVKSSISAREVTIAGAVHGNVTAKGKLTILASGKLFGNTNAASFIIEEGGIFQGVSKMAAASVREEEARAAGRQAESQPASIVPPGERTVVF